MLGLGGSHGANAPETVVGWFYQAAFEPALWPEALDAVAACLGARGALLPGSHFVPGALPHSRGMGDVLAQFFEEGWHLRDKRTHAALRLGPRLDLRSALITDQELFTAEEIAQSRYYAGFARSADVPWFCATPLAGDLAGDYIALSLQRTAAQGAFLAADQQKLQLLLPHLRNAVALGQRLLHLKLGDILGGLDRAGTMALLVKSDGRVLQCNAAFERLQHPALLVRGGRLQAAVQGEQRRLAALLALMAGETLALPETHGPLALWGGAEGLPLVLHAAPFQAGLCGVIGLEGLLLTVKDLAAEIRPKAEQLREIFQLTPREAEVIALIGGGQSLEQIARLLLVSKETVRFHLKAVLSKSGAHRQSDLVALCHRLF